MKTPSDPPIDEIRRIRREISRELDHAPGRLVDDRKLEEQHRNRLIPTEQGEQSGSGPSAA